MSTERDTVLVDTSVALRLVDPGHPDAATVHSLEHQQLGLSGHAALETYAGLTSRPRRRLSPQDAGRLVERWFVDSRFLSAEAASRLPAEFAEKGIIGGQVYDGLVAAAAREHGLILASCDRRAEPTYRKLGVRLMLL